MAQIVWHEGEEGSQHLFEGGSTSIGGGQMSNQKSQTQTNPLLFYVLAGLSIYYIGF